MVLVMILKLTGCDVQGNNRRGVEIVAWARISHPWPPITGTPVSEI